MNMGDNKLDKDDAAELTDSTPSDVAEAWHDARDDAEESGDVQRGSEPGEAHGQTEIQSLDDMKEVEATIDETAE